MKSNPVTLARNAEHLRDHFGRVLQVRIDDADEITIC
jgi:hypothetical protein